MKQCETRGEIIVLKIVVDDDAKHESSEEEVQFINNEDTYLLYLGEGINYI